MGWAARLKGKNREERIANAVKAQQDFTARVKMDQAHMEALGYNRLYDKSRATPPDDEPHGRRLGIIGHGRHSKTSVMLAAMMVAGAMGGMVVDVPRGRRR